MKKILSLCIPLVLIAALFSFNARTPSAEAQKFTPGEPFHCVVAVTTTTALTAVGGSCGLPAQDQSLYITHILASTNSAGIAADSFMTLKYGLTTATVTLVWGAFTAAAAQDSVTDNLNTPFKIPAGNQLYFINATAGSKFWVIDGYRGSGL